MYVHINVLMINPSSDVCKKCFIVAHNPTKRCCGADLCYFVFEVDNMILDHSIFSNLVMFRWGQSKLFLCLCHVTQTIVAFQPTRNEHLHVSEPLLSTSIQGAQ